MNFNHPIIPLLATPYKVKVTYKGDINVRSNSNLRSKITGELQLGEEKTILVAKTKNLQHDRQESMDHTRPYFCKENLGTDCMKKSLHWSSSPHSLIIQY